MREEARRTETRPVHLRPAVVWVKGLRSKQAAAAPAAPRELADRVRHVRFGREAGHDLQDSIPFWSLPQAPYILCEFWDSNGLVGAGDGDRTRDVQLGNSKQDIEPK